MRRICAEENAEFAPVRDPAPIPSGTTHAIESVHQLVL